MAIFGLQAQTAFAGGADIPASRSQIVPPAAVAPPMDERDFWALVDQSAKFETNPDVQLATLRASLNRLPANKIADFERVFDQVLRRSYSWDLWGAAYLGNGGASDDGFEYFRCWLISKGQKAFETVVADPDSLADTVAQGPPVILEFEDFAYVAREAWSAKTGRNWNEMPVVAGMMYAESPGGVRFNDNPAELAKRYPKLWTRFGTK